MADLDDFFAKKDRKKAKSKKFTTADEIAKKLEETGRRNEKLKKDISLSSQSGGQETDERGNAVQDEDEWREFEEEKKDYTGLKIQNITLDEEYEGNNSGGEGDEDGGLEENEAGEMVPKKKNQGPWRVVASEEQPQQQQPEPQPQIEEEQVPEPEPKSSGSYVAPAFRNSARQTSNQGAKEKPKVAPDMRSEELFPSLSAAKTQDAPKKKREDGGGGGGGGGGFEEVKNSKSHTARYEPPMMRNNRLALGNKFGALNSDQS